MAKKELYRIHKMWSKNCNMWVYYIERKGWLFWHTIDNEGLTYTTDEAGTPITNGMDFTRYFKTEEGASNYLMKNFTERDTIVKVIEVNNE